MRPRTRFLLFLGLCAVVIAWVAANDGEHAAAARHFLRNLLRYVF